MGAEEADSQVARCQAMVVFNAVCIESVCICHVMKTSPSACQRQGCFTTYYNFSQRFFEVALVGEVSGPRVFDRFFSLDSEVGASSPLLPEVRWPYSSSQLVRDRIRPQTHVVTRCHCLPFLPPSALTLPLFIFPHVEYLKFLPENIVVII